MLLATLVVIFSLLAVALFVTLADAIETQNSKKRFGSKKLDIFKIKSFNLNILKSFCL